MGAGRQPRQSKQSPMRPMTAGTGSIGQVSFGPAPLKSRDKSLRRQFEMLEFKAWRHGAADQGEIALTAGHLPLAGRHHQLRHLRLANGQLQRCAAIEVPDFRHIDPVPARDLCALEQEIDGGRAGAPLLAGVAKCFAEMTAFRMRLETEQFDQTVGFSAHALMPRLLTCTRCQDTRESSRLPDSYSAAARIERAD